MGCTVIIFSRIKILSETHDVIPVSSVPKDVMPLIDKGDKSVTATLIFPTLDCDVEVRSYTFEGKLRAAREAASLAAAVFLFEVRGLVFDELYIKATDTHRIVYKRNRLWTELCSPSRLKRGLCADIMGVGAPYSLARLSWGNILVIGCCDILSFDLSLLPLYLCHHNEWCGKAYRELEDREIAVGAVVYSQTERGVSVFSYFPNGAGYDCTSVLSSLSFLARSDREISVRYTNESFYLLRDGGRVLVSSDYERPLTFEFNCRAD